MAKDNHRKRTTKKKPRPARKRSQRRSERVSQKVVQTVVVVPPAITPVPPSPASSWAMTKLGQFIALVVEDAKELPRKFLKDALYYSLRAVAGIALTAAGVLWYKAEQKAPAPKPTVTLIEPWKTDTFRER